MEHAATPGDALEQVEETAMMAVDLVGLLESNNAMSTTDGATAGWAEVVPEAARNKLLAFAFMALIDCHIAKALEEGPVDTA